MRLGMAYTILKNGQGGAVYFSPRTGRQLGNPLGGWVTEKADAIQFARDKDAQEFIDTFLSVQREGLNVAPV